MDTVDQTMPQENATDVNVITDVEFREVPTEQPVESTEDKPLSLPETVTFLLNQAGVVNPEAWLEGLHPVALSSTDINMQRFLINQHWRLKLLDLPTEQIVKTMNARGCLVDGRWELADWIKHFRDVVIPCAIEVGILIKQD